MDHYFEEEEFNTQFNGHTLRRIAAQAKPHWRGVAGFVVLIALVSLNDSVFTYLSKLIIDEGILAGDRARLNQLFIIYGSLALVQAAAIFGFIYLAGQLGERIQYELRRKMFNHLQSLSLSYYSKTPIGWIMSRVTSDSARISELITWGLIDSSWAVFNLSTALRQPWTAFQTPIFVAPLALVGVRPDLIVMSGAINLVYQFWIHTEVIGRLGAIERVLNTPSHHRVHHGSNQRYLDTNYGGILIVWDRLFGTFEAEVEPVRYGLTKDIHTYNLWRIAFHEWAALWRDCRATPGWGDRFRRLWHGPGWEPT